MSAIAVTFEDAFAEDHVLWTLIVMLDLRSLVSLRLAAPGLGGFRDGAIFSARVPTLKRMPLIASRSRSIVDYVWLRHWQLHSIDVLDNSRWGGGDSSHYDLPTDMYRPVRCLEQKQNNVWRKVECCAFLPPEAPTPFENALLVGMENARVRVFLLSDSGYVEHAAQVDTGLWSCGGMVTSPGGTMAAVWDYNGELSVVLFARGSIVCLAAKEVSLASWTWVMGGALSRRVFFVDERVLLVVAPDYAVFEISVARGKCVSKILRQPPSHPDGHGRRGWLHAEYGSGPEVDFLVLADYCEMHDKGSSWACHRLRIVLSPGGARERTYHLNLDEEIADFVVSAGKVFVTIMTDRRQAEFREVCSLATLGESYRHPCPWQWNSRAIKNLGVLEVDLNDVTEAEQGPPAIISRFFVPSYAPNSKEPINALSPSLYAQVFYKFCPCRTSCNRKFFVVHCKDALLLFPLDASYDAAPFSVRPNSRCSVQQGSALSAGACFMAGVVDLGLGHPYFRRQYNLGVSRVCQHLEDFCQAETRGCPALCSGAAKSVRLSVKSVRRK
jgi:hypothetical protein